MRCKKKIRLPRATAGTETTVAIAIKPAAWRPRNAHGSFAERMARSGIFFLWGGFSPVAVRAEGFNCWQVSLQARRRKRYGAKNTNFIAANLERQPEAISASFKNDGRWEPAGPRD